jgi:hypothetical protein
MLVNAANAMWDGYLSYQHSQAAARLLNESPIPAVDASSSPLTPLVSPLLKLETLDLSFAMPR